VGIVGKLNKEDIFVVLDVKDILGGIILKNEKIFIFLVMSIFLISFTSALTFDNVKDYNSDLKEVTI